MSGRPSILYGTTGEPVLQSCARTQGAGSKIRRETANRALQCPQLQHDNRSDYNRASNALHSRQPVCL